MCSWQTDAAYIAGLNKPQAGNTRVSVSPTRPPGGEKRTCSLTSSVSFAALGDFRGGARLLSEPVGLG